eukprot:scaffold46907_cov55-Phaeocystis_antarctica.AAC.2
MVLSMPMAMPSNVYFIKLQKATWYHCRYVVRICSQVLLAKYHEEVLERSCSLHATEGGLPSRRNRCSKGRAVRLRSSPGDGRGRSGPKNLAWNLAWPTLPKLAWSVCFTTPWKLARLADFQAVYSPRPYQTQCDSAARNSAASYSLQQV